MPSSDASSNASSASDSAADSAPDAAFWQVLDGSGQSAGIFFPRPARNPPPEHAVDYEIPVADGVKLGARWHRFDPAWRTVLAFHGNGETVPDYDEIALLWKQLNLNFFIIDYRGYGWSDGRPSLQSLYEDPERVAAFFLDELEATSRGAGLDAAPRPLLFGRSLGGSAAARIAAGPYGDRFAGLILESAFGDIRSVLVRFGIETGPLREEVHRRFSNPVLLKRADLPTLILHGARDELLPPHHARENFAALQLPENQKTLHIIEGAGHNNMLMYAREYAGAVQRFAESL